MKQQPSHYCKCFKNKQMRIVGWRILWILIMGRRSAIQISFAWFHSGELDGRSFEWNPKTREWRRRLLNPNQPQIALDSKTDSSMSMTACIFLSSPSASSFLILPCKREKIQPLLPIFIIMNQEAFSSYWEPIHMCKPSKKLNTSFFRSVISFWGGPTKK